MISIYKDFDNPPKDLLGDNPKITRAVKQALYDLYHGKCAYTEEKLDFEEMIVAQYRPVSLYPALEFEWSNLLPVSEQVNILLSNKFPIDGEQVEESLLLHVENRKVDSACLLAEEPLLLHPEVDTPDNHIASTSNRIPFFEGHTRKGEITSLLLYGFWEEYYNLLEKILAHRQAFIVPIFKALAKSVNDQYTFDKNKGSIEYKNYESITQPYFKKLYPFFNADQEFSFASKSYIEEQICSINRKETDISADFEVRQIIFSNYYNFSPKTPTVQQEWDKSTRGGLFQLTIKSFQSIKKLELNDLPLSKWIFLTGENGAGKSLLLQAIAASFFNKPLNSLNFNENTRIETNSYFPYYQNYLKLTYYSTKEKNFLQIRDRRTMFFAAYGPSRLSIKEAYTDPDIGEEKLFSIFQQSNTLENIESYLAQLYDRTSFKERYENIKKVLLELLPTIEDIQVDTTSVEKRVFYIEKTTNTLSFRQLSSGNQSIIAMIGDMIIRLIKTQDVNNPSDLVGIVLIDEIDIHLHPNWQKKFVQTLTKLFPKIQFIASTHSPIPLLGAPKETVILNVEKPSSREGIKVRKLDIDVTTLTPNTILTSPIFGFEGIISDAHDENEPLYTGDTYNDVLFEKHLDKKLEDFAKNSEVNLDDLLNSSAND